MKEKIMPENIKAIGPYSPAIKVGNFVFISGQLGLDPKTNELKPTLEEQTEQALINLSEILSSIGLSLDNVVKTTIFLVNMEDFQKVNEIYSKFFKEPYPARSTIAVRSLPRNALIEIEAIAYVF
ncbi:MAG: Rid family detoxifying hydrolase [candidate division WOR-3 bacterium]|jgi:2-iminobutanoate/2-iminopropanoate deaminase